MRKIIFLSVMCFCFSTITKAQSVVSFCSSTNQWGYSFGGGNIQANKTDAFQRCINAGGQNPRQIIATTSKGYGAIAVGKGNDGTPKFGTSAGARTAMSAKQSAIQSCLNEGANSNSITIKATWADLK